MKSHADLRPAQRRVIAELMDSAGVIAVLGMGSGKTAAALTAIAELLAAGTIRAAIVVAPRRVARETWPAEVREWQHLKHLDLVVLDGPPARRRKLLAERHDIYAVGMDNLQWLVDNLLTYADHPALDQMVIDEISKLRDPRGKRAQRFLDIAKRFQSIWGLTGTPRPEGEEDLWMQLQVISAGTAWAQPFDLWRRSRFMPMDYNGHVWRCHEFAKAEVWRTFNTWAFTVPPADAINVPFASGDEFDLFVDLCDDALRDLRTMEKKLLVEVGLGDTEVRIADYDEDTLFALSQAVARGKMTQILQGFLYADGETLQTYAPRKLDRLLEGLDEAGGDNAVVLYHYREDLEALRGAVPGLRVLGAGTSDRQAARIIHEWNERAIPRLALHPASAGHGLNLQFGGRRLFWYTMPWSKEQYAQTIKRLARPGQAEPVFSHRVRARHWVEDLRVARVEHGLREQEEFVAQVGTV